MTLNKHQGIRAALCWTEEIARLARQHNDANVWVMPARFIDTGEAGRVMGIFFSTGFEGGRHQQIAYFVKRRQFIISAVKVYLKYEFKSLYLPNTLYNCYE
jgi:ribose 5-phosphate isomerase B